MPRFAVQHDGQYLEWSTVCDAPLTYGMSADEFRQYYAAEYGRDGAGRIERVMARAQTVEDIAPANRAGPNEEEMSEADLIRVFFVEKSAPWAI